MAPSPARNCFCLACTPCDMCNGKNSCTVISMPTCSFFEDYKRNEQKEVTVDEIMGREKALETVKEAMVRRMMPMDSC